MKYKVRIDDTVYEVELNDLHVQPIIALVNGESVEVWLESEMGFKPYFAQPALAQQIGKAVTEAPEENETDSQKSRTPVWAASVKNITAPIPGVIVAISVKPGDAVEVGSAVCVLEAMKMKNTIRSPRIGIISRVNVIPGQTVQHREVLVEFEEN
jgi:propionyl-CoA carboxylase alpha chain